MPFSARFAFAFFLVAAMPIFASAQSTAFSYQATLLEAGEPVDGLADFQIWLYDAEVNGSALGIFGAPAQDVVAGLVSIDLDYGAAVFDGSDRWLEVRVRRPAGTGTYVILSPRQRIGATPYALQTRGIHVDANENVGIGTTAPVAPLEVVGTTLADSFSVVNPNSSGASVNLNWHDDVARIRYGGSGTGSTNGFAIQGQGDSVKMRVFNNGALGVGTAVPGSVIGNSKLDVAGGHVAVNSNFGFFSYHSSGGGVGAGLDTTSGDDLHFYADGAAHVGLRGNGNFGIGTLLPSATLDVRGEVDITNVRPTLSLNNIGTGNGITLEYHEVDDELRIQNRQAFGDTFQSTVAAFEASGRVGIGTVDPDASLHIESDEFAALQITQTDNTDFARLLFDGNGSQYQINVGSPGTSLPNVMNIHRSGTGNIVSILPDGDVGIGTSSPTATLHVDGDARFEGPVTIPTTTRYATISAPAFHPRGATWVTMLGGTPLMARAPATIENHCGGFADVALPHGARVTEIRANLTDNSDQENMTVELMRYGTTGNDVSVAAITSSGRSSSPRTFASTLSHTIDNQNNAYFIYVDWDDAPNNSLSLRSVRVKYTVDEPLP